MRYLVTGGAGFLGSNLVKRLASEGNDVIILDDFSRGKHDDLPGTMVHGDIRDPDWVTAAMQGCDRVVHMAYIQGTGNFYAQPRKVLDVAIRGMLNVLSSCEKTGCGELLLISSSEVYHMPPVIPTPETVPLTVPDVLNPRYSYGGGKIACELMALAFPLNRLIIARPHNVYGPDMGRDHVIPQLCLRMNDLVKEYPEGIIPFPIQGTGQETRSFCYIDDCISQFMVLLDKAPDGIYHVGVMEERTIGSLAYEIAARYGRMIKIIPGELQKGSPLRRSPDTGKIRALDASMKETSLSEGLARTVGWYRND